MSRGVTLLARVIGDVRYTLMSDACGSWNDHGRDVRAAVVHCDDLTMGCVHRAAWAVTVRLEAGERVEAGDASARSLPDEIEREVIALLLSARRAA